MTHLSLFSYLKERRNRIKWERRLGFVLQSFAGISFFSGLFYTGVRLFSSESKTPILFLSLFASLFLSTLFFYVGHKMRTTHYCRFCLKTIGAEDAECPSCGEDLTSTKVDNYR